MKLLASSNNEVSALAVLETVLISILSIWLVYETGFVLHLVSAACLAPFLLLRSKESVALGVRIFNWLTPEFKLSNDYIFLWSIPFVFLYLSLASLIARVLATVRFFYLGIPEIPKNWCSVALKTDLSSEILTVPGGLSFGDKISRYLNTELSPFFTSLGGNLLGILLGAGGLFALTWTAMLTGFSAPQTDPTGSIIGWLILVLLAFALLYACFFGSLILVTAMLWRYSIKISSLAWVYVVFIVHSAFSEDRIERRIDKIKNSPLDSIAIVLAIFSISFVLFKIFFSEALSDYVSNHVVSIFIDVFLAPGHVHMWHIAAFLNGFLFLTWRFVFIDNVEYWIADHKISPNAGLQIWSWVSLVRGLISYYTIFVSIYFLYLVASRIDMPSIDWRFFPF